MRKRGWRGAVTLPDVAELVGPTLLSALDAAGVAVVITGPDPRSFGPVIQHVNRAFETMTGYTAEEVTGRPLRLLQGLPADRETIGRIKAALRDGRELKIETVNRRKGGEEIEIEWTIAPIRNRHGAPEHWIALLRDLSHDRQLRRYLAAELQHRTRNLLATVRSIASRTLAQTREAVLFGGRLAALGRVQALLGKAEKDQVDVDLDTLVRAELAAHDITLQQVTVSGDAVSLPHSHIQTLALALHELAINAREHGALASSEGALSVGWSVKSSRGGRMLALNWVEISGNPLKNIDPRRGYGRELIEGALPFTLGARTRMEFQPTGLWCRIDLPLPPASAGSFLGRLASIG